MRKIIFRTLSIAAVGVLVSLSSAMAQSSDAGHSIYDRYSESIVAVKYVIERPYSTHDEPVCCGVVVREDGLVMVPLAAISDSVPDEQMKDFKILVPRSGDTPLEIDAVFQGRDRRYDVAFVKTKDPQKWSPLRFEKVAPAVGDSIYSIGLLPTAAGMNRYLMCAMVSGQCSQDTGQIVVGGGGLACIGSPVFDRDGHVIGLVNYQAPLPVYVNETGSMLSIFTPPRFVTPSVTFANALIDPPTPGHPVQIAWAGLPELLGLNDDASSRSGISETGGIRIGKVPLDTPAHTAGLKEGDIVVKLNGTPIKRHKTPDDLVWSFRQQILLLKPDSTATVSILPAGEQKVKDVTVVLKEEPIGPNAAARFWTHRFDFEVREMVPIDGYSLGLEPSTKGVIITSVRASSKRGTAFLHPNDVVTEVDHKSVDTLADFQSLCDNAKPNASGAIDVTIVRHGTRDITFPLQPVQPSTNP